MWKHFSINSLHSLLLSICSLVLSLQDRFAEIFGNDAAAEDRKSQESFKKWLLAGVTLVTGVVVGSLIAQKRLWAARDSQPDPKPWRSNMLKYILFFSPFAKILHVYIRSSSTTYQHHQYLPTAHRGLAHKATDNHHVRCHSLEQGH